LLVSARALKFLNGFFQGHDTREALSGPFLSIEEVFFFL
jgi:hypothetical protein